jgi:hypothetical protein
MLSYSWTPFLLRLDWTHNSIGRDSSVGTESRYGLDGPGIEFRWGSARVQTAPEVHPASCTMGTGYLSWRQRGRDVTLTTQPHLAPRVQKSPSTHSRPVLR